MDLPEVKKIVIIEDNIDVSLGFTLLINSTPKYRVIQTFTSCEEAMKSLKVLEPDIILMDLDLPGMSGIEGTDAIKKKFPNVLIMIITVFENSDRVFDALCAGASGYLTKNTNHVKLLSALDELCEGGAPMSTNIARMVVKSFAKVKNTNPLTDKESKILQKLLEGKSYKSLAQEMVVSIDTIKYHIKNIYIKLQVTCKEDAIAKARANNWY